MFKRIKFAVNLILSEYMVTKRLGTTVIFLILLEIIVKNHQKFKLITQTFSNLFR